MAAQLLVNNFTRRCFRPPFAVTVPQQGMSRHAQQCRSAIDSYLQMLLKKLIFSGYARTFLATPLSVTACNGLVWIVSWLIQRTDSVPLE